MEKPSIRIPHPAPFWFVVICLGGGACAFLVMTILRALCGDFLNVFLCLAAAAIFIAGVRFEVRMSGDFFRIDVKGKGAHVSMPHKGVDALYVASQIVVAVQSIVARSTDPMESAVVGIGKAWAGTQYNIVAEEAVLEGTVRTFLPEVREATNRRRTDIVEKTAEMLGANASIVIKDYSNPLINDADATKEAKLVAQEIVGAENIVTDYPKSMMAEDFADYLPHCKGTFVYFGTHSNKPGTDRPNHNGYFDIDEEGLLVACNMFVRYALHALGTK